jgi:hypothetical protein
MATSKKVDKALHGPGVIEIVFGALLGLMLGLVCAFAYLVFKPVQVIKAPPKEVEKGVIYYQEGSKDAAKARALLVKRQRFLEGSTVSLTEDELNAWVATWAAPQAPDKSAAPKPGAKAGDKAAEKAAPPPAPQGVLVPAPPNFRILEGKLQIGLQCKINLPSYGFTHDLVVQALGGFKKQGDRLVFDPDTIYLGSCPVHKFPGLAGSLVKKIVALYATPEEVKGPWAKLTDVSVEGNALKLTVQ